MQTLLVLVSDVRRSIAADLAAASGVVGARVGTTLTTGLVVALTTGLVVALALAAAGAASSSSARLAGDAVTALTTSAAANTAMASSSPGVALGAVRRVGAASAGGPCSVEMGATASSSSAPYHTAWLASMSGW